MPWTTTLLRSVCGLLVAASLTTVVPTARAQSTAEFPVPKQPPPPASQPVERGLRPPLAQHVPQQLPPPLPSPATAPRAELQGGATTRRDGLSLFDAAGLKQGELAMSVAVGFPWALLRAGYGITDAIDLGIGFNTLYGLANQPSIFGKYRLVGDARSDFAIAVRTDLEVTFFKDPPGIDRSRWLTGQRDFSVHPGFILSLRTDRGLVFFTDLGVQLNLDTRPLPSGPLSGGQPEASFGANVPLRMGLELPLSRHANLLALWGLDLHFRREDSRAMPVVELGVTFGGRVTRETTAEAGE